MTWYFPPSNRIGAVRLGGLADFLLAQGHDLKVVTCENPPYRQTLPDDFPPQQVIRAKWVDVNALPKAVAARLKGASSETIARNAGTAPEAAAPPTGGTGQTGPGLGRRLKSLLSTSYTNLVNWPDQRIGWLPYAVRAGRKLLKDWKPDLVFASAPPFTTLLVGALLSRSAGAPLVLEFRDRWWDDPYYPPPAWLRAINRFAERRLVSASIGLSTVSEPWAETYRARYGKPTVVIYNGYDADILNRIETAPAADSAGQAARLRIVYTGGIYPGRRDPSLLFQAIRQVDPEGSAIEVNFYGTDPDLVLPLAEQAGVRANVVVHAEVSHEEAIARQKAADVLLLMQWNDPKEQGNVPGKFFEYIGTQRPILVLGLRDGVPASIARERGAGVYGADVEQIAAQLADWLAIKRRDGALPAAPERARQGFSRQDQYKNLADFFESLSGQSRS